MSLKISDLLSGDSSKESVQMGNLRQILATTPNAEEVLGEEMPTVMSKLIEILSGTGKSSFSVLFFLFLFFGFSSNILLPAVLISLRQARQSALLALTAP
jgi:hypothetical protein